MFHFLYIKNQSFGLLILGYNRGLYKKNKDKKISYLFFASWNFLGGGDLDLDLDLLLDLLLDELLSLLGGVFRLSFSFSLSLSRSLDSSRRLSKPWMRLEYFRISIGKWSICYFFLIYLLMLKNQKVLSSSFLKHVLI